MVSTLLAGIGWFFGFVGFGLGVAIIYASPLLADGIAEWLRNRPSRQDKGG